MPVLIPWCTILIMAKKLIIDISHNRKKCILANNSVHHLCISWAFYTEPANKFLLIHLFTLLIFRGPHQLPMLLFLLQNRPALGCVEIDAMVDDRKVTRKGKQGENVALGNWTIRLFLLNSCGRSTSSASTGFLKVTFVPYHRDYRFLDDADTAGAVLRAVHVSVHFTVTALLCGPAVMILFTAANTEVQRGWVTHPRSNKRQANAGYQFVQPGTCALN